MQRNNDKDIKKIESNTKNKTKKRKTEQKNSPQIILFSPTEIKNVFYKGDLAKRK